MLFVFFQYVLPHLLPFLRCKISLLASALSLPRGSLDAIKKCNFPEAFKCSRISTCGGRFERLLEDPLFSTGFLNTHGHLK